MRRAVRIYVHHGFNIAERDIERFTFADHATRAWLVKLLYFLGIGFRLVAVGCEEGAMVAHVRNP
jgi:hypothetical protein